MTYPTCARCEHYLQFVGYNHGECYGQPPAMFQNGSHTNSPTPPPHVRASRPRCHCFEALPEGEPTRTKGKQTPETPGDALKLAHKEHGNGISTIGPGPTLKPVDVPHAPEATVTVRRGRR